MTSEVRLVALAGRIEKAALATGLAPGEFRLATKRNAGELVVGLLIAPSAKGFSPLSIP